MRPLTLWTCVVLVVFAGLPVQAEQSVKADAAAPAGALPYVDNTELAKLILKPPVKPLQISRDPFKPLIEKEKPKSREEVKKVEEKKKQDILADVMLVGVARFDSEYRAFIKVTNKSRLIKVGDALRDYKVKTIDPDQVVFHSDTAEIIKKRGKK